MKTIDIITNLKLYAKTEDKQILADMLFAAEQEYKREQTKKQGGNQAVKRLKLAEKILKRNQKDNARVNIHKCTITEIDGETMQVFGTPYYQIALKEEYGTQAETWSDDEQKEWASTLSKVFNNGNGNFKPIDFDLTEIKAEFEEWKAEQKRKPLKMRDDKCILRIGNVPVNGYNAEYFINCVEALGNDVIFMQNQQPNSCSFFESEIGKAIIFPVRIEG